MSKTKGAVSVQIDPAELEKLARFGCTQPEMAHWFGMSLSGLEKRIADEPKLREIIDKGYASLDISLRRRQVQLAEAGNPTMLIWLGKQRLEQRDRKAIEVSGPLGAPMEHNVNLTARERLEAGIARVYDRLRPGGSAQST